MAGTRRVPVESGLAEQIAQDLNAQVAQTAQTAQTQPLPEGIIGPQPSTNGWEEGDPGMPPIAPVKPDLASLPPKDLLKLLDTLSPSQLAAVRGAAIGAGLAPSPSTQVDAQGVTLPDGRVRVLVEFDPDLGEQLKLWAEAQNSPLADFIVSALTSYVQMDWSAAAAG